MSFTSDWVNVTLAKPDSSMRALALVIVRGSRSIPTTSPEGPTIWAASIATSPTPEPISRTLQPGPDAARYVLRIREPNWCEHRMFKGPVTDINLHVFSSGCPEIDRMLMFRDWLRSNAADRDLYARTKLALARRSGGMSRITPTPRPSLLRRSSHESASVRNESKSPTHGRRNRLFSPHAAKAKWASDNLPKNGMRTVTLERERLCG